MNSNTGATINRAQTQMSLATTVMKKSFEAEKDFASAIKETVAKSPTARGVGEKVDIVA